MMNKDAHSAEEQLRRVWGELSTEAQNLDGVIAAKDERKGELT